MRLIVKDAVVPSDGRVLDGATIVVEDGVVAEVREAGGLPEPRPGDWRIDAGGRLTTSGLFDGWRVLPPAPARAAGLLMDALLLGTTTCLVTVPEGLAEEVCTLAGRLGLRLILAPRADTLRGTLEATRRMAASFRDRAGAGPVALFVPQAELVDASGLHDAWESAQALGLVLVLRAGTRPDVLGEAFYRWGMRPVEHFSEAGVLGPRTVVVGGGLLGTGELDLLARTETTLVASPREDLLASRSPVVGRARQRGVQCMLGTGGSGPALLDEVLALAARTDLGGEAATEALEGGADLLSRILGTQAGHLREGALADLVVHRWRPTRAVDRAWPACLPAVTSADWVIVGGRVAVREGEVLGVDSRGLAAAARKPEAKG